jgi:formylglycine-generating enzyme required for sulfatase activity
LEAQLQDAQEQLAKAQKESLQPKVDPRIPKLEAQLQDAQGQLAEARQESLQPKADPRIPQLEAQLRDAQDQLANARNESLQPRVAELQKTVDALRSAINSTKPTPPPKPGEVRLNQTDQSLYAFIPAGAFQMGCVASDPHCRDDEKPAHLVTLTHGFWMSSTEVTVKAYRLFATAAGGALPKENTSTNPGWRESGQPMSFMQWDTAQSFCEWAGGRLPTEAEWEYAARGGKDGSVYPWGEAPDRNHANWMGKGGLDKYTEVADAGTFLQNPWNLYDIIGNLGEWVADYYGPYDAAPSTDPKGPDAGKQRVIRGGSWAANEREIRTSVRKAWLPTEYSNNVGFRCVLDKLP